jgi:glycine cleavage system regulatory protein
MVKNLNLKLMNTSIVLTIIAEDQPGIIKNISAALDKHGGSWTQSSMSSLAGHFAGILLASVPSDKANGCLKELKGLEALGLKVIAHVSNELVATDAAGEYTLDVVGNDRRGIINAIARVLAGHDVNVNNLESEVESAAMGGGEIFRAQAQMFIPPSVDIDVLEGEIEDIANDLMVKINKQI